MTNIKYYAFKGEHNVGDEPAGVVRLVNQSGNIIEGTVKPDGKMNGFCITFDTLQNLIHVGWYINNKRNGNWMQLKAWDMTVSESGWYFNDERKGSMKYHAEFQRFSPYDIF